MLLLSLSTQLPNLLFRGHPQLVSTIRTLSRHAQSSHGLVRPITVRTCIDLYPRLRQLNPSLYPRTAPAEGIDLTVNYVDTAHDPTRHHTEKTILAIPGAAGYYTHFDQLINHYRDSRVRVIAPNLPDFSHTRQTGLFWHTTAEKVAFLRDFLKQIGVDKIDCAVGHSLGAYSVLGLVDDPGTIQIKSVALMAPQPLYDMTPSQVAFAKRVFFASKSEWWFNFLARIGLYKMSLTPAKFDNINDFLLFLIPVLDSQTQVDLPRFISGLSLANPASKQIPVTITYGTREKFISPDSRTRIFTEFGLKPQEVVDIDPDVDLPEDKIPNDGDHSDRKRIQGYMIKGGGHFAYANYETFTNRIVNNLMQHHP